MNTKQFVTAAALVFAGFSAVAAEGEQWIPETGSLTRAEVKAELARAQGAGEIVASNEAYAGFVAKQDVRTALSREFVRGEARAVAQSPVIASLYVGG
jgi:Domain of unknown function (DUF4148)